MSDRPCPQEPRVLEAWRAGNAAMRRCARTSATCESCREAIEALEFMRTLAAEPLDLDHRIPDAGRVWWRAQLVRRWEAERRVAHQLDRMYPFQAGLLAASVILGVVLSWPAVQRWVAQTEVGEATMLAASLVPAGMVTSFIGGAFLLALVMIAMARDMLAE